MRLIACLLLPVALLSACNGSNSSASERTVSNYAQHCQRCHDTGAANAPRRGDAAAWKKRLEKGRPALVASMIAGPVAMPPRGGCTDCTDEELGALLDYLVQSEP